MAQIVELVGKAQASRAPIQKLVDSVSNIFVPTVLIVSVLTFAVWFVLLSASFTAALFYAIAVLIIAASVRAGPSHANRSDEAGTIAALKWES